MKQFLLIALSAFIIYSCDLYEQNKYQEFYVVESYLIANQQLPDVRITKTSRVNKKFDWDSVGTHTENANVRVRLLNSDSTVAETYEFQYSSSGAYSPVNPSVVKAKRWYQLHITFPNGDVIKAKTRVPGQFEIVKQSQKSYKYKGEQQIKMVTTPSMYPERPSYYIFTASASDTTKSNLTPFYRDLVNKENAFIKTYYINTSSIVSENDYKKDEKSNLIMTVPWSTIAFYGENKIIVNAIDDNLYDFWRTYNVQSGISSMIPGKIQNMRYHIKGGIGIFGSMATDTNRVNIVKP